MSSVAVTIATTQFNWLDTVCHGLLNLLKNSCFVDNSLAFYLIKIERLPLGFCIHFLRESPFENTQLSYEYIHSLSIEYNQHVRAIAKKLCHILHFLRDIVFLCCRFFFFFLSFFLPFLNRAQWFKVQNEFFIRVFRAKHFGRLHFVIHPNS